MGANPNLPNTFKGVKSLHCLLVKLKRNQMLKKFILVFSVNKLTLQRTGKLV